MSIQWTFIAGFLYFEIGVVIIMMLPLFSPRRWHQFFRSRLFFLIRDRAVAFFYVLLGILALFLLDAIREMRKYSHGTHDSTHAHLATEMRGNVKMFRAQRNFYITGFAIFLAFVIRRLIKMIIVQDELTRKAENIVREAQTAMQLAKRTVLATNLQTEDIERYEELMKKFIEMDVELVAEKNRSKEFEEEAKKWKVKYEEIASQLKGKGDE